MNSIAAHTTTDFSKQYYLLRESEGRIYTDEEVRLLPTISPQHRHYKEWLVRKGSCDKLVKYVSNKNRALQILEVGCGNGWLAANLAAVQESKVTGIDVNAEELAQAIRVFNKIPDLEFFNCSLNDVLIKELRYDIIVFAASIQYFPSLKKVLAATMKMLKPAGEIHLLDSNFYAEKEIAAAKQRTMEYYQSIGFPEMINQYFHHAKEDLAEFDHEVLYDPHSLISRFTTNKNPFYWIKINA